MGKKKKARATRWSRLTALHDIKPGGAPGRRAWTPEPDNTLTATCPNRRCGSITLIVRYEDMARRDRRPGASKVRLVAYCPDCKRTAWRLHAGHIW
jgi:hypothetical protein